MHDLYLFNPDNEISVGNGTNGYTPKANVSLMADDLAFLMAYLAGEGDHVLVSRLPDKGFVEQRRELFGLESEPVLWEKARVSAYREPRPWGWSPRVHNLLEEIKTRCDDHFREGVMATWSDARRELYSRPRAAECLSRVRGRVPEVEADIVPRVCYTIEEIRACASREDIVVKAPWSSSGKGILFVPREQLVKKEEEILSGMLQKQGYVMVERRLDRVLDFALEFKLERGERPRFLGYSVFETGKRGEYTGNTIAPWPRLEGMITRYINIGIVDRVREALSDALFEQYGGKYEGYLGVDMMIYRDGRGNYRLQPCVEINLRYNMGIVAMRLQRQLASDAEGQFLIRYENKAGDILSSVLDRQRAFPLQTKEGRMSAGYIHLTPVERDTRFVAELILK